MAGLSCQPKTYFTLADTFIGKPPLGCVVSLCTGQGCVSSVRSKRKRCMSSRGLEKTVTKGFGWIAGDVVEMTPEDPSLKIPQIGWNTLDLKRPHALFDGVPTGENGLHAYFVHSYHLAAGRAEDVVAETGYGGPVTAFVARDNKAGSQFHPEKSQALGLALISNFLRWKP